jgi:hypothetical protein
LEHGACAGSGDERRGELQAWQLSGRIISKAEDGFGRPYGTGNS